VGSCIEGLGDEGVVYFVRGAVLVGKGCRHGWHKLGYDSTLLWRVMLCYVK